MLTATFRGRLAPSPTGCLHRGHARTFWVAWQRACAAQGKLIFRNEDLDYQRCRPELDEPLQAEPSQQIGEGLPDSCGPAAPGSETNATQPVADDELPYPGTCREKIGTTKNYDFPAGVSWRFKVPDGETISFDDGYFGPQEFVAGRDFADFFLWRRDDIPAYQLAVVVDDAAMQITEVVRGADLLKSTARQLLLIRTLGYPVPAYFHCPL